MMAACSVASRSSHARKDIAASETQEKTAAGKQQESAQPDSTVQDKTPGPVIKEVHHPVKRPASVRDSLSAADSALMAPRPTVSDSLLAIVNIGSAAAVRKNFFRNTTVNDAVRDEAEFTFLAEDIQGFKPGDKIIHKNSEWRVDKLSLWDTIADTIVLSCSKNNKGFARGFEK
jgi:hypothetical protein